MKSAEIVGGSISVSAVNTWHRPARIDAVNMREIYLEPKQRRLFIGIGHLVLPENDGEELTCRWRVSGVNLANHGEAIVVEVIPSKALKDGHLYEIRVERKYCREELKTTDDVVFKIHNMGTPAAFIYKNGRLKRPQEVEQLSCVESVAPETKFCINCGIKIQTLASYCTSCGAKQ